MKSSIWISTNGILCPLGIKNPVTRARGMSGTNLYLENLTIFKLSLELVSLANVILWQDYRKYRFMQLWYSFRLAVRCR